jgi:hypothetical protein
VQPEFDAMAPSEAVTCGGHLCLLAVGRGESTEVTARAMMPSRVIAMIATSLRASQ